MLVEGGACRSQDGDRTIRRRGGHGGNHLLVTEDREDRGGLTKEDPTRCARLWPVIVTVVPTESARRGELNYDRGRNIGLGL